MKKKPKTDCRTTLPEYEVTECNHNFITKQIESIRIYPLTKIGKDYIKKVSKSGRFMQDEMDKLRDEGHLSYKIKYIYK